MANIALVTAQASHGAPVNTKSMLESFSHSVSIFESATVSASELINFDIIVWCRGLNTATVSAVMAAYNTGIPIICGLPSGTGPYSNTPQTISGLITAAIPNYNGTLYQNVEVIENTHSAISEFNYKKYETVKVTPNITFLGDLLVKDLSNSTKLLVMRDNYTALCVMAIKGDKNDSDAVFPASIIHCGWLYGLEGYTAAGANMINNLITHALDGNKIISGTVIDEDGDFASRRVSAIDRDSNGKVVKSVLSSVSDGTYSLNLQGGREYIIVCDGNDVTPLAHKV